MTTRNPGSEASTLLQQSSDAQEIRDEIYAECFAEYLAGDSLRKSIERRCNALLRRVRRHNPDAVKLVKQYRKTLLERTS